MKKQGYSEEEIWRYLTEHGFITPIVKAATPPPEIAVNVNETLIVDINEDTWRHCILRLINESETMTPAIIDKIRDYLDKKKAISQAEVVRVRPSLEDVNVFSQ